MARFYGFDYNVSGEGEGEKEEKEEGQRSISFLPLQQQQQQHPPNDFQPATRNNWLTSPFSHNHLRITRIIRSCRLLGLEAEACAFHNAVAKAAAHPQFARSRMYWQRAAERPLYLAPEDDEVDDEGARGRGFLRRFEEERERERQRRQDILESE
ncbi:MAG: hypothetical protein Q9212_006370 [Teloschistes hypoglaucus]